MTFYSPYQFIPVTGRRQSPDGAEPEPVATHPWPEIAAGRTPVRHDGWDSDTLSGRLLCRLRTVTPTLVGAEQGPDHEGRQSIANYRLLGELAIPGSSLRGAIAAVAEAISQSAMRVLIQREFSVRKGMHRSLKALGILRRDTDGSWRLLPLALTGVPLRPHTDPRQVQVHAQWQRVFPPPLPLSECVAAYCGDYRDPADDPARFACFQEREAPRFLYSAAARDPRLSAVDTRGQYVLGPDDALYARGNFAVRHRLTDVAPAHASPPARSMRGVAYVLGRRDHGLMPKKHHEWFVPYAEDWEDRLAAARPDGRATLPVRDTAIAAFERIAAERWADNDERTEPYHRVPFLPKGYRGRRPLDPEGQGGFLHDGDLVYFDVDQEAREVTEVSFSAIWREAVRGDLFDAFARTATPDVLPWHPQRGALTPAECLFGVVEDLPRDRPAGTKARNLASRVSVSDARGLTPPALHYAEPVALRQLQSPKPPSPAMYFRTSQGGAVRKQPARTQDQGHPPLPALNLKTQVPNGRKYYLPHDPDRVQDSAPWETRKLDGLAGLSDDERRDLLRDYQRQGGRWGNPLAADQDLWFHVDFENLAQAELDLLWTAIDPGASELSPDGGSRFHHRLGWGRPVGLGVVRIEVAGLFLISRHRRYTAKGVTGPRHHRRWLGTAALESRDLLGRRYPEEFAAEPNLEHPDTWRLQSALIDLQAVAALLRLGDPGAIDHPVCYPYLTAAHQSPGSEEEGFEWFVANDARPDARYQSLGPLRSDHGEPAPDLPHLES